MITSYILIQLIFLFWSHYLVLLLKPIQFNVTGFIWMFYKLFKPALADGISLESEWQQVSSSVLDSTLYSGHGQQCCNLDGLDSFSRFISNSSCPRIPSESVIVSITNKFIFYSFHLSLVSSKYFPLFFLFPLLIISRLGHLWGLGYFFVSQSEIIIRILFFRTDFGLYIRHVVVWSKFRFLHYSQRTPLYQ